MYLEDFPFVLSLSKRDSKRRNYMSTNNITTESYLPEGMPLPAPMPDGLDAPFWEGTRTHKLLVQRCHACGGFQFGPEWICHKCRSSDVGWAQCSGYGKVYAFERVWHPVHKALRDKGPYIVVLVELPDARDADERRRDARIAKRPGHRHLSQ